MCGIFFYLSGIKIKNQKFNFNPFYQYIDNPYIKNNQDLIEKHFGQNFDFIQYIIENNLQVNNFTYNDIKKFISNRGPDHFKSLKLTNNLKNNSLNSEIIEEISNSTKIINQSKLSQSQEFLTNEAQFSVNIASSLLYLRGDQKVIMPIEEKSQRCYLAYNGEIYQNTEKQNDFNVYSNDTQQLFDILLENAKNYNQNLSQQNELNYETSILENLNKLLGDYSFVFFDYINKKIVVTKGIFGKRSVLMAFSDNGIVFSSNPININQSNIQQQSQQNEDEFTENEQQNQDEKHRQEPKEKENLNTFIENKYFQEYLSAKNKEWIEIPSNSIMIGDFQLNNQQNTIDYIEWSKFTINSNIFNSNNVAITENMKSIKQIPKQIVDQVSQQLRQSVLNIVQNIHAYIPYFQQKNNINNFLNQKNEIQQQQSQIEEQKKNDEQITTNASISILFSGGLDSALLTYYIDQLIPPWEEIDLINLSFSDKASDRQTAITAYQELKSKSPDRKFNLILIDKDASAVKEYENHLLNIIYPKITHMDFNITLVLNLASKGEGYLYQTNQNIKSGSKIIISGLGADEIFGGYSRYRVSFLRGGFQELYSEMNFDLNRIWIRNLGRDDRAISANGKEARFPFLDTQLIKTVQNIDFQYFTSFEDQKPTKKIKQLPKTKKDKLQNQQKQQDISNEIQNQQSQEQQQQLQQQINKTQNQNQEEILEISLNDKRLLRQVAYNEGLPLISGFKKKAIQFGTGLAKQSNKIAFGSHSKGKGTSQYLINNNQNKI